MCDYMETPDTVIFIFSRQHLRNIKCFHPHNNYQVLPVKEKRFSVHLFAFGELPGPNSTASAFLSASASHYQHEKVKEMCCHGYMVCL